LKKPKKLAKLEDEEEEELGLAQLFKEDMDEEEKSWKYLPYNPIVGNECDEALAEQLNIWEIDVNIRRLKNKKKKKKKTKNIYKVKGKKYIVRYIHGMLLCKEIGGKNKSFQELIPLLREIAGMPSVAADAKPKKKRGIKIHGH